jgi:hypothetical protein
MGSLCVRLFACEPRCLNRRLSFGGLGCGFVYRALSGFIALGIHRIAIEPRGLFSIERAKEIAEPWRIDRSRRFGTRLINLGNFAKITKARENLRDRLPLFLLPSIRSPARARFFRRLRDPRRMTSNRQTAKTRQHRHIYRRRPSCQQPRYQR